MEEQSSSSFQTTSKVSLSAGMSSFSYARVCCSCHFEFVKLICGHPVHYTACCNIKKSYIVPTRFIGLFLFSKHTSMFSLCSINRLFFILETDYVLHGDDLTLYRNWMKINIHEFKESLCIPALL